MSEDTRKLGQAVDALVQRVPLLISEEIALAKAEVNEQAKKLGSGAVVGVAAGLFAVWALLMLFLGLASLITWAIGGAPFWGYFIVTALLLLLAGIAGAVAAKLMKSGSKKPTLALEEARLIRETVKSEDPTARVGASGRAV